MNSTEIALIREGFAMIELDAERIGMAFYDRLFAEDPSLKTLFRGDKRTQADYLMITLTMVVRSLDDLAPVLDRIQALGRRYVQCGARRGHLAIVGTALLATLEAELGAAFTPAARAAWSRAHGVLSEAMIEAMDEATRRAVWWGGRNVQATAIRHWR